MTKHDTTMPQFYTLSTPKCTGTGFTKWTSRLSITEGSIECENGIPAGIGPPDVVKATCPVRGALGGNLLLRGDKAPSFDSMGRGARPHSNVREQLTRT